MQASQYTQNVPQSSVPIDATGPCANFGNPALSTSTVSGSATDPTFSSHAISPNFSNTRTQRMQDAPAALIDHDTLRTIEKMHDYNTRLRMVADRQQVEHANQVLKLELDRQLLMDCYYKAMMTGYFEPMPSIRAHLHFRLVPSNLAAHQPFAMGGIPPQQRNQQRSPPMPSVASAPVQLHQSYLSPYQPAAPNMPVDTSPPDMLPEVQE